MTSQHFTDNYLLYLLAQASSEASAQFHAELKKQGIPVLNWRILASLYPERRLTIGELAHHALANQTTLTRAVDRLEKAGAGYPIPISGRPETGLCEPYAKGCRTGQGIDRNGQTS